MLRTCYFREANPNAIICYASCNSTPGSVVSLSEDAEGEWQEVVLAD